MYWVPCTVLRTELPMGSGSCNQHEAIELTFPMLDSRNAHDEAGRVGDWTPQYAVNSYFGDEFEIRVRFVDRGKP